MLQKKVLEKKVAATLINKNQKITKNINVLNLFVPKGSDHL